jgi:hypothetical protein
MLFSNDPRAGIFADDLVHTFETTELMPEPTTITLLAPAWRVRRRPEKTITVAGLAAVARRRRLPSARHD